MANPEVLIGVVTHTGTKHPEAAGQSGLGSRLATALEEIGLAARLSIEDGDLWSKSGGSVSPGSALASRKAELVEDRLWRQFLGSRSARWWLTHAARWLRAAAGHLGDYSSTGTARLLNIEYAHRSLWREGLASGAEVVVVLEDDALCSSAQDVALGLSGLMGADWSYVNLSRSFESGDLGIRSLLKPSGLMWSGDRTREVLRSEKPVTNTVCAVAYRRAFLEQLDEHWAAMPLEPVLPIDWKLNRCLRQMVQSGTLAVNSALWVEPAPIIQTSLHHSETP